VVTANKALVATRGRELFELAMHDRQYRDYKSGAAKARFESELAKAKEQVFS